MEGGRSESRISLHVTNRRIPSPGVCFAQVSQGATCRITNAIFLVLSSSLVVFSKVLGLPQLLLGSFLFFYFVLSTCDTR